MKKYVCIMIMVAMVWANFTACGSAPKGDLDELLSLGLKYLSDGEYEEAIVSFEKVIEIDDKCIVAYMGAGDAYLGLDKYPEAAPNYETVIGIDEKYIDGYVAMADTYLFEEEKEKAIEILETGYENTEDSQLKSIITEINAGTYVPNKIHVDLSKFKDQVSDEAYDADDTGVSEVVTVKGKLCDNCVVYNNQLKAFIEDEYCYSIFSYGFFLAEPITVTIDGEEVTIRESSFQGADEVVEMPEIREYELLMNENGGQNRERYSKEDITGILTFKGYFGKERVLENNGIPIIESNGIEYYCLNGKYYFHALEIVK